MRRSSHHEPLRSLHFRSQSIEQAGGVGQIKPCPRPLQEYVTLMTDLMALDSESGRLVKKSKGEDGSAVAGAGAAGGGGGGASTPPGKPRRKPRPSTQSGTENLYFSVVRTVSTVAACLCVSPKLARFYGVPLEITVRQRLLQMVVARYGPLKTVRLLCCSVM